MIAELVFMMGQFEARFPANLLYSKNHMWALPNATAKSLRFGLSAYAVRLLQDVYFLDLVVEPGMLLASRQEIGSIESKKAESSLYAPVAGEVIAINENLLNDPTAINLDKYGDGWLFELNDSYQSQLLTPEQYIGHLKSAWEIAQRTIKGQANVDS
ncbi:MAG: glycine cleavage system protein H [Planctomycetales bacterium]|nr:glycine cleavage system protein H [Planctomycetales bacterium]